LSVTGIDVLKEGGKVWTSFFKSGFVPDASHTSLAEQRRTIKTKLDASGKDMKREGGIGILSQNDEEAASNLLDSLEQYGLFTVRHGEVESWLKAFKFIPIFEKMGSNPNGKNYLKPKTTDVWKFIKSLKKWLDDTTSIEFEKNRYEAVMTDTKEMLTCPQ
jgi:hypothetical protein